MVAYSPASRTAEMVRSTKRATPSLGAARVHRHPFRARHVVRKDDGRAAVGLVLLDDEWVLDLLAELGLELDDPARKASTKRFDCAFFEASCALHHTPERMPLTWSAPSACTASFSAPRAP